jgi:HAD superfamily phosphoserine phosphatase-like hydrolase
MARLRVMIDDWLAKEWDAMISLPILQELEKAQKENAFTAILSNSPDFIVEPISRKLKVDGWLATRYRSDANGGLSELHSMIEGKDKADYIDKLSREKGIPRSSIAAYSDSIHDLPFLLKAGCPVAVNPDRSLKSHCMRNRWKIIQVE